jgi:regulator of sigma E protease
MSQWIIFIIIIWAIISINLWIFNLLPIPALDWWRFLFIVINSITQKLFRKKILNENIEWLIHVLFFIILIALSLIIAYNDINKIIIN